MSNIHSLSDKQSENLSNIKKNAPKKAFIGTKIFNGSVVDGNISPIVDVNKNCEDPSFEKIDSTININALFKEFNKTYFYGKLRSTKVEWSKRLTSCAGKCYCKNGCCTIRLSIPLLKTRSKSDLINTLLHEMIHAYLFLTNNEKKHEAHGKEFKEHMKRINEKANTNISVYHSYFTEYDNCHQYWWKCDGICQNKPPHYGIIKRSVDRAPGPYDNWFLSHQQSCGGTFHKIRQPLGYGKRKPTKKNSKNIFEDNDSGEVGNMIVLDGMKDPFNVLEARKRRKLN